MLHEGYESLRFVEKPHEGCGSLRVVEKKSVAVLEMKKVGGNSGHPEEMVDQSETEREEVAHSNYSSLLSSCSAPNTNSSSRIHD